jgi:hypothetical protein
MRIDCGDIVMVTEKIDKGRLWFGYVSQIISTHDILICCFSAKPGADPHRENSTIFHFDEKYNDFKILGKLKR